MSVVIPTNFDVEGRLVFFSIAGLSVVALLGVATGASVGRLFAGFVLLSVGLGLALKSPLENMFSDIRTILVSPFRIGTRSR